MENLFWIGFLGALVAGLFAVMQAKKVLSYSEGSEKMRKIAANIRAGANAYLKQQYTTVFKVFIVVFVILLVIAFATGGKMLSKFTPFAFVTGGIFSMLAGFIGMKIATNSNARTAQAASESLNKGLRVAFSSGSVMGFTVVGLGMLDITMWFFLLRYAFGVNDPVALGNIMVMNGMGASFMALFARVGGGIYTKAADVGADLVGKVEAGIPEDDPRNPATIADNVGDNVGDVAGMGADLYESYVGSLISSCSLGVIAFGYIESVDDLSAFAVPLLIAAVGVGASIIGSLLVRTGESTDQMTLLKALRRGTNTSAIIIAVAAFPIVWFLLGKDYIGLYVAILAGLFSGVLIGRFTEYYTSDTYVPTQSLAASSVTGTATLVIDGLSLGMRSTMLPVLTVSGCILIAYYVSGLGLTDGARNAMGLYGIALAAVGMLSTLGITLATDAYGPVADNAGGIAEMSGLPETVRQRTDALDSLGNTTAATGKGFAIGSAALTALALIASYVEKVETLAPDTALDMSVMNPVVLVGIFVGACLAFIFAAITMGSVGKAAHSVVLEVRRQFKEIPGIIEGTKDADFARCVDLCTKASLKEMVVPTLIAVGVPIVGGLLLGPAGVIGLLCGATASGFLLAVFMSNSGGSWDNAKKYVEAGHYGGKGSKNDKSAIVGDTIGDPFKDTSGPAINILIKLLSMVSIVFATVVVNFHMFG